MTPQVKRSIESLHLGGIVWGELSSERLYADGDLMGALWRRERQQRWRRRIEQVENKTLTGTDGHEAYQRGNGGEEIPGTMTESVAAKNNGDDVTLTDDRDVQWYVKKVLKRRPNPSMVQRGRSPWCRMSRAGDSRTGR